MTTDEKDNNAPLDLLSVNDYHPIEEGGPIARAGFTYQDFIASTLLLDMVEDEGIASLHCETMDDLVIVFEQDGSRPSIAEFVQVKTSSSDSLWSIPKICTREKSLIGNSIFEKSLSKDRVSEFARFRIVTSQEVRSNLKPLTYCRENKARALTEQSMTDLKSELDRRCPEAESPKGNDSAYWLSNVLWEECGSLNHVRDQVLLKVITFSSKSGTPLFVDQAEKILLKLMAWVKEAGDARFVPDKYKKIITRAQATSWWINVLQIERDGIKISSGGKLRLKMAPGIASPDMVEQAVELRRQYVEEIRTPRYMAEDELGGLRRRVCSALMILRTRRFAGEFNDSPNQFHARCQARVNEIADDLDGKNSLAQAFALGCMYDVTDRCQLSFESDIE